MVPLHCAGEWRAQQLYGPIALCRGVEGTAAVWSHYIVQGSGGHSSCMVPLHCAGEWRAQQL